jgi:hypothetical protein
VDDMALLQPDLMRYIFFVSALNVIPLEFWYTKSMKKYLFILPESFVTVDVTVTVSPWL